MWFKKSYEWQKNSIAFMYAYAKTGSSKGVVQRYSFAEHLLFDDYSNDEKIDGVKCPRC